MQMFMDALQSEMEHIMWAPNVPDFLHWCIYSNIYNYYTSIILIYLLYMNI